MGKVAHLTTGKDRTGRFSGYYKCSLCPAEFRPNPENVREILIFFAAHIRLSHTASKTTRENAEQRGQNNNPLPL
jgi:hypothetical protein